MSDYPSIFKSPESEREYREAYSATLALWPVEPEPLNVETGFGVTHINACGPRDAETLILLHGGTLSSTSWYRNVGDLSKSFRIYAVDTMGDYGLSIPSCRFSNRRECAEWLVGVMGALGLERANVAGLSYGGWLALNLARYAPESVRRLVLMSPVHSLLPIRLPFYVRAFLTVIPYRPFFDSFAQYLFGTPKAVDVFKELINQIFAGSKHVRPHFFFQSVLPDVLADEELQKIDMPTLLMVGDREVIYDPHSAEERATRLMPHIETKIIPNAGHSSPLDQPGIINASILDFLKG